jgi:isopentenyldiphosphate isomerase
MDEMVDVLDERGEKTGEVAWKSEAHRAGLRHRCFHCWILDPRGPYLFVQLRAAGKDTWPDLLDVTAAGHLRAGEETLDGLREVEEELGLLARPEELLPLGTRKIVREIPGDGLDREFQEAFLLVRELSPPDLRLQEEEVAALVRLDLDDVEALHEGAAVPGEEWTAGGTRPARARLSDFVPEDDAYLLRVARAAREVLAGDGPGRIF